MTVKRIGKKIGRNNRCPCGSGKKYKKCCLSNSLHSMSVPLTHEETRVNELFAGGRDERLRSMLEIVQVVSNQSMQSDAWNPANDSDNTVRLDALRLKIVLDEITIVASEVLRSSPHSRQYWFLLLRRLAPMLWEELLSISNFDGNPSPYWISEVIKVAGHLVLTCSSDGDPWEWVEEGGIRGIDYRGLSRQEMLVAARVFSLAQLRYEAQVRFRFACKGFRVFSEVNNNDVLTTQNTASIERYEERRSQYETITGSAGLWCDPAKIFAVRENLCHWMVLAMAAANEFVLRSQDPPAEMVLQYLFQPFSETGRSRKHTIAMNEGRDAAHFIPYDYLIEHPNLRLAFESAFGVKSEHIVAFLYSVFRLMYTFLRLPRLNYGDNKTIELVWVDEAPSLRE